MRWSTSLYNGGINYIDLLIHFNIKMLPVIQPANESLAWDIHSTSSQVVVPKQQR